MAGKVHVVDHPLVQHKLSKLRRKDTSVSDFRALLHEISILMGYEVLRDLATEEVEIETPLEKMKTREISGKKLCIVPVLRAGTGFVDGLLQLVPVARVGHIGLYRDHETLKAIEYYMKLPDDIGNRHIIMVDPMLATGNSAVAAIDRIKRAGGRDIKLLCLVAAPEGIRTFHAAHEDVPVFTAAIDRQLNEHGYILPGLGDAGDRLFGTK